MNCRLDQRDVVMQEVEEEGGRKEEKKKGLKVERVER